MPKANEVAIELRKFADSLDRNPDAEIIAPRVSFFHYDRVGHKESFLALAKLLPRPIVKGENYSHDEIKLTYENDAIYIGSQIPKAVTCELVEPAKPAVYRCTPILSLDEEATLEDSHV